MPCSGAAASDGRRRTPVEEVCLGFRVWALGLWALALTQRGGGNIGTTYYIGIVTRIHSPTPPK